MREGSKKWNNNTLKYPAEQKLQKINMFGNTRMTFHFEVVALLNVDAGEAGVFFFINQNTNAETKLMKDVLFEVFDGEFQGKFSVVT